MGIGSYLRRTKPRLAFPPFYAKKHEPLNGLPLFPMPEK